jgi:hypothetical protein
LQSTSRFSFCRRCGGICRCEGRDICVGWALLRRPGERRDPYAAAVILQKVSNAGALTDRPRRMGPGSRPGRHGVFCTKHNSAFSRRTRPKFCTNAVPPEEEAGNAGCTLHPRSRVQIAQRNAHTSIQVQRRHSGIPCAMVLRLMPCSPRRRIRLVTVAAGLMAFRSGRIDLATDSLAPATGVGTTRFCRTHQRRSSCAQVSLTRNSPCDTVARRRCRVHRIPSHVRDDARPPLLPGKDGASW